MEISEIVNGNYQKEVKEALNKLKSEKMKEVQVIKNAAITKKNEIGMIKAEMELYHELSEMFTKESEYAEKYNVTKEAWNRLSEEFDLHSDYNKNVFKLNNEIETIDKVLKRYDGKTLRDKSK